jgi:hypothetical protein
MPDVTIEISVSGGDADLGLGADDEELVFRVHTGARPCMRCRLNAQSAAPQAPPLHSLCECRGDWERRDGSISSVLH